MNSFRSCFVNIVIIGVCGLVSACKSTPDSFEANCPATLPQASGHMDGVPPEWTVATGVSPSGAGFNTLGLGDRVFSGIIFPDRRDRLANGDVLLKWIISIGDSPYMLCRYNYTTILLARKIPDNMKSCQYLSRQDEKARQTEKLKCSTSP